MRNLWIVFVLGLMASAVTDKLLVSAQGPPSSQPDDLYLEGHPSGDHLPVDDEGDDEGDDASGSGDFSGDFSHRDVTLTDEEKVLVHILEVTQSTPPNPPTTAEDRRDPPTTAQDSVTSSDVIPEEKEKEEYSEVPPAETEGPTADWSEDSSSPSSTTSSPPPPPPPPPSKAAGGEDLVVVSREDAGVPLGGAAGGRLLELETPEEGVTSESLWERTEVLAAIIACGVVAFLCAVCLLLLLAYRMKKKDEGSYDLGVTKVPPTAYQKAPTKEFYA